jgi:cation transport ATPase
MNANRLPPLHIQETRSMKRTVWTFGLISGAILSAMMLLTIPFMDEIGFDRGMVVGYTTMVLAFLLVFFGVRSYRDNVAGGSVGFGRAFTVGALIALIASACYVATWQVLYFKFQPDFLAKMQAYRIEKAQAAGDSPAEIQALMAEMEKFAEMYQNPAINAAITFLEPLPVGLIFALVTAGVLSRRRRGGAPGLAAAVPGGSM